MPHAKIKKSSKPRRSPRLVVKPVLRSQTPKVAETPKAAKPTSSQLSIVVKPVPKVTKTSNLPKKVGSRVDQRQQKAMKVKPTASTTSNTHTVEEKQAAKEPVSKISQTQVAKKKLQALIKNLNKEIEETNKETTEEQQETAKLEPLEEAATLNLKKFIDEEKTVGSGVPQSVKCRLCKKAFEREVVPKVLSCGHTFCQPCIQQLFAEVVVCPVCSVLTFLPADKLCVNLAILQHNEQVVLHH